MSVSKLRTVLDRLAHFGGYGCSDTERLLFEFVEGELDPETQKKFEMHVSDCPPCLEYIETYRRTIALTRDSRPPRQLKCPTNSKTNYTSSSNKIPTCSSEFIHESRLRISPHPILRDDPLPARRGREGSISSPPKAFGERIKVRGAGAFPARNSA